MLPLLGPYYCFCQRDFEFRYDLVHHLSDQHSISHREIALSLGYRIKSIGPLISKAKKMYPCRAKKEELICTRSPGHRGMHGCKIPRLVTPMGVDNYAEWE